MTPSIELLRTLLESRSGIVWLRTIETEDFKEPCDKLLEKLDHHIQELQKMLF